MSCLNGISVKQSYIDKTKKSKMAKNSLCVVASSISTLAATYVIILYQENCKAYNNFYDNVSNDAKLLFQLTLEVYGMEIPVQFILS